MNQQEVDALKALQKSGLMCLPRRKELLQRLYKTVQSHEEAIAAALKADFNKNAFDAYATETGLVLEECRHALKNLTRWARPKRVKTSMKNFPAKGRVLFEAYGTALIVAPWNYPVQLSLMPLIGAIAAGCTAVVKPSTKTPHTYQVLKKIIQTVFDKGEVLITDSRNVLDLHYDLIFFTGGAETGKTVLEKAAKHLTPAVLELGGKSPAIVDEDADLIPAARRLAWAKTLNAGQTCVAPDYFLIHTAVYDRFVDLLKSELKKQCYTPSGELSPDFPHLISKEKGDQIQKMLLGERVVFGGSVRGAVMEPTLAECDFSSPLMQSELFAPVAPLIRFSDLDAQLKALQLKQKPLALYVFGKKNVHKILTELSFGGGCVNDAVMHVSEGNLPFGGVGASGMGRYHAKASFLAFTHQKSILIKGRTEIKARYAPHSKKAGNLLHRFER